jgi:hypothetical protein
MDIANTKDAAAIAAEIDLATVTGWNLRALLLKLLDGDDWRGYDWEDVAPHHTRPRPSAAARHEAADLRLLEPGSVDLTPLGREVLERLRPVPWRCRSYKAASWGGVLVTDYEVAQGDRVIPMTATQADAERIASLLTKADAEEAKRYKPEPRS